MNMSSLLKESLANNFLLAPASFSSKAFATVAKECRSRLLFSGAVGNDSTLLVHDGAPNPMEVCSRSHQTLTFEGTRKLEPCIRAMVQEIERDIRRAGIPNFSDTYFLWSSASGRDRSATQEFCTKCILLLTSADLDCVS